MGDARLGQRGGRPLSSKSNRPKLSIPQACR
ncbi:MAG: hypothetical protein H7327_08725 [Herminiimonas sp.]|nr:hypothetical protein [Herminiimonas sp.]